MVFVTHKRVQDDRVIEGLTAPDVRRELQLAERLTPGADERHAGEYGASFRMAVEKLRLAFHDCWQINVVSMINRHILAARRYDAVIYVPELAAVFRLAKDVNTTSVGLQNCRRAIGRGVIHHQNFHMGIRLGEDGIEALPNVLLS